MGSLFKLSKNVLIKVPKLYKHVLVNHPIRTQAVQTGLLMLAGDVLAQTLVERKSISEVNLERMAQFGFVGVVLVGPALTIWYRTLTKKFGEEGKYVVLKKVAADQLGFAPIFIAVFLGALGLVQGKKVSDISTDLEKNYTDILYNNYKLWPCVQLCNFYFVPLNYRVLVAQSVAVGWNTYLSFKTQVV